MLVFDTFSTGINSRVSILFWASIGLKKVTCIFVSQSLFGFHLSTIQYFPKNA